jgi:hypothetical protein
MTGSHSELRYCRFQVPKNRKVFRRIFEGVASGERQLARWKANIRSKLWDDLDQGAG